MFKRFGFLFYLVIFTTIFAFGNSFIYAQDDDDETVSAPRIAVKSAGTAYGIASGSSDEEDDTKVTGATVRGRIYYEDTNRPVRFVSITLMTDNDERYTLKYVKTDENGEFVIKNVKPGTYLPFIKSEGVLTPEVVGKTGKQENDEPFFERVTVSGLGEIQIAIRAKRGGAVSGRIQYTDGESAVGVKVEVLKKQGEKYGNVAIGYGEKTVGAAETDDRGIYRMAGLPAGTYVVRVNEPFSHSQSKAQYAYEDQTQISLLKTYYPEGESTKTARELEITLGQEQTDINITLPERQLFDLTGKIVSKKDKQPLENFTVSFFKLTETDAGMSNNFITQANSINANKVGDWTLKNLPKGKYRLTVSQAYVYRTNEQTEKPPEYPRITREFEITDKNIDDIIFEIPVASSLSGTIVTEDGKLAPNAMVFAFNEKTKEFFNSQYNYPQSNDKTKQPDKVRSFQIPKMAAGNFKISMSGDDYYVKSITLNGRDVTNSSIEIGEGKDISGLQIVVSTDMGMIKGKVNNFKADGRKIAVALNPNFKLAEIRGNSFSGMLGANGEFQIKAKPGEYAVIIFSDKNMPQTEAEMEAYLRNAVANAPKVTVKSKEISNVSLEMPN